MKKADDNKGPFEGRSNNGTGPPSGNNAAGPSHSQGSTTPSGFVYHPKQGLKAMQAAAVMPEDIDEDTNMNTDEETRADWQEVKRAKDRFFAAAVMLDSIHGETAAKKRLELEDIMLQVKIHCTEGPTRIKVNDEPAFRIAVETKEDLDKEHMRAVKEFQKGGALRVTPRKSFAAVAGGNENKDSENQQQQQTSAKQSGSDSNTTSAQTRQSAAVDKKINQLTETVERLQAEQRQLVQQNSVLLQLVVTMMTQHLGVSIPAEQLVAAGLSADINRNTPKTKNGKSVQVQGLPSTNELLANVMTTIVTAQNTKAEKKKGEGVGATTSSGQSSKSVVRNE
ncbi:hypothetical protein EDD21DRAFT_359151 [Dissophora ornata]|nr:hypothetical protein EDD21DRAFT_359151 [Dissophora ornata]